MTFAATYELAELIRVALGLLPPDELLGELEASNSVTLERNWRSGAYEPAPGNMDVTVTTYLLDGRQRKYQLLRRGNRHELFRVMDTPPEFVG